MRKENKQLSKSQASNNVKIQKNPCEFEGVPLWHYIIPPALLTFFTTLIYYPSLYYPFQFDDLANISKKFAIRYDNPLTRWWTHSRWMGDWLNVLNYRIARFEPFYYRLTNLVIHLLAGIVLFFLIFALCRFLTKKMFFYEHALLIASATSALFLLHPVQTQTVSYVIQARIEGLATLLVIATIYFFVQIFNARHTSTKYFLFLMFFLLGLFSWGTKEIVIVLPFLLLLVDWFFISQEEWHTFKQHLWIHGVFNIFFFGAMLHYLGSYFIRDVVSLKSLAGNNRGNIITSNAFSLITPFNFFISQFRVVLHYLTMFVWPFGISVEYDWKIQTSFFSFHVIFPLLMLFLLFGYGLYAAIKKERSFIAFGLFWFLIGVAPRSSFIPSPELIFDYKTYLASIGIFFILATIVTFALTQLYLYGKNISLYQDRILHQRNALLIVLFILTVPVGIGARMRNKIWESSLNFWGDNAKKAPLKARVHNNYGVALSEAGRVDESIQEYKKAIALDRYYQDPLSNLAIAYSMKRETDKAIDSLKAAIRLNPRYTEAYNNIGSLYLEKKLYADSEKCLLKAIALRPYYGKAFFNLARLYEAKKQPEKVWEYLKKATEGDFDLAHVFYKFGILSLQLQKYKDAAHAFEKTIERGTVDNKVWFSLANAYFMLEQFDKAQIIYERLVQNDPTNIQFTYNLAETFFSKKQFAQALALFEKTTTLPKPLPQAFFRIAGCFEQMKKYDDAKNYLNKLLTFKAPDNFIKVVKNEITRITLQEKLHKGNGSIRLSDLKQALA